MHRNEKGGPRAAFFCIIGAARQRAADLDSGFEATCRDLEALDRTLALHDICVPP